jgi:hypothetical protein
MIWPLVGVSIIGAALYAGMTIYRAGAVLNAVMVTNEMTDDFPVDGRSGDE